MLRQPTLLTLIGILCATLLGSIACGNDEPGFTEGVESSGDFGTSVSGGAEIGNLSSADKAILCADVQRFARGVLPDNRSKICTLVASILVAQADLPSEAAEIQSCEHTRDECLAQDAQFLEDDCLEEVGANCSATVNEYAACVKARTDQLRERFDKVRACSDINPAYLDSEFAAGFMELPSECNIVQTVCPSALEDGDIFDDELYDDYAVFE